MAKCVTIKLTPKQRADLRKLTGTDHTEVMFEKAAGRTGKVAARASLARKTPLSAKGVGKGRENVQPWTTDEFLA